ncbi:MAG: ArnT family glycosyltransferase [Candidatus Polarisedimenticolia bacterium]
MATASVADRRVAATAAASGRPEAAWGILAALAVAKILTHLPAMTQYDYFRDELYYLASTEHLGFGYVDHPPLSIAVLAVVRALLGDSLPALRLVPLLAGVAVVVMCGLLAREMGGGRAAQGLAGLAALVSPMYLAIHHYYSMNALDHLVWTAAALLMARLMRRDGAAGWPMLGLVLGLGLLNKISTLWLGLGLAAGIVLTQRRRWIASRGPWVAALIAFALFAPHIAWQAAHDWPTLEFVRNATTQKMVATSLGPFLMDQILSMNPATAPLWIGGLAWCLWPRGDGAPWRLFGVAFLAVFALLAFSGTARASYMGPAYPMLFAPGSVALEAAARRGGWRRALRPALVAAMVIVGALLAPFGLPLLPPDTFLAYMKRIGIEPSAEERGARAQLPQQFADMFGWDEMASKVAAAWNALPEEDRARGAVFAQNYGEAGALDVLGRRLGLPPVSSGHNSYWMWGPTHPDPHVIVVLGGDEEDNRMYFEELTRVDTIECPRCMPYERDLGVYVGRGPKMPLAEAWPRLKNFI